MKKFIEENWLKIIIVVIVIVLISLLTSMFLVNSKNTTNTQIANPASVNCINNSGKLSIVDKPEGQVGMCTFSNGTVCEEWAYFRGECKNEPTKTTDLIQVDFPQPNQIISSPLVIKGKARGTWFFEASFPVVLTNWDGLIIAQGIAKAQGDWMTTDFVPFEATLTFTVDKKAYSNRGALTLRKDNPSGLSKNDDSIEIPVVFAEIN
jgi:putative hemolysin